MQQITSHKQSRRSSASLLARGAALSDFVAEAERQLGVPVRPFTLDANLAQQAWRLSRKQNQTGLGDAPPLTWFGSGTTGRYLQFGLEFRSIPAEPRPLRLVRMVNPFVEQRMNPLSDVWATPVDDYPLVYRTLRRSIRERARDLPPVMAPAEQRRLWDHTIGFLRRGEQALARFGVPLKRGVLLMGEPGNGKTMAARWLMYHCQRAGLEWRTVRTEEYEQERSDGNAHALFQLPRPGIILFDDFDTGLRNRETYGVSRDHATFLSELDGIDIKCGVVYLFTSNVRLNDLDPAFQRPGRIDQIISFPRPTADLREVLIRQHWPAEIVAGIPVADVVAHTAGMSFAEIEEIKKLLVLQFLDHGRWDWAAVRGEFATRDKLAAQRGTIGFQPRATGSQSPKTSPAATADVGPA